MKRYAFPPDARLSATLRYDVLIVGAGVAGLYTAMNIDPRLSCAVITKESIDISNSWLAQGGIAAVVSEDDKPLLHVEDTLIAGAGVCDRTAVETLVEEGPSDIKRLVEMKVPFDLGEDGLLQITREGGHTRNRIVHAGGDATGRETVKVLAALVGERPNVTFLEHAFLVDILTDEHGVSGALVYDEGYRLLSTRKICICTGGVGQIYMKSTNPSVATGDGIAAAVRAGAELTHMEFIQFHPTGLYDDTRKGRSFLISEAVRGEGAILKNNRDEPFMQDKHPMKDLAPRDIVARAIVREMSETGAKHVWLDATVIPEEHLLKRFPTICGECLSRGIDPTEAYIPVAPVQHYMIGGIKTDLHGRTNVPGLYACGEAAYTGVHGANRLASNSMLECLVFGRRSAVHINETAGDAPAPAPALPKSEPRGDTLFNPDKTRDFIKRTMSKFGGVIRNGAGLREGIHRLEDTLLRLDETKLSSKAHVEALAMATVGLAVLKGALDRKESVGAHFREDAEDSE
ncbi:L-aspartate oxidase [Oscillospiraceae bacterium OttesenSCG-928-G22]|nr:L-aspartate oxidase [Oscillospiraceae bacterium OttesenSCG-928-G22]